MHACVARQPIFKRNRHLFGYELLFRSGVENAFCKKTDGDFATASLISDSIHLHGVQTLTCGRKCFINVTRNALLNEVYTVLSHEGTVVELLETIEPDDEVITACRRVREGGYLLALDDYVLEERFNPLLPLIDILKVECVGLTTEQQVTIKKLQRKYGFDLLAEKVEDFQQFERARRNGYTLFQGFFFCKPEMIQSRRLPASRMHYVRFLQEIHQHEMCVNKIETLIRQDVSLSYKLLRYLNSASFGFHSTIESIRHAITLLGQNALRKWASLVAINELCDEKPTELMTTCLIRGRFCELLGEASRLKISSSDLFTLGMFSLLDAMLDQPMQKLIANLPLPEPIRAALVGDESTQLRPMLDAVIAFEQGNWSQIVRLLPTIGADANAISDAYREAMLWSINITKELQSSDHQGQAMKAAS